MDSPSNNSAWQPIAAIALLTLAACSGAATIVVGPPLGVMVAITVAVILGGYVCSSALSALFFRGIARTEEDRDD
jgi:hypothetical protein